MAVKTEISWCDSTWNPVRGCTKVSPGCANCYAERWSKRFDKTFDVRLVPEALELPLHWRKPRRIFVNSMSDLFHPEVPNYFIANVFSIMENCRDRHTFQVLTKRPERMRTWVSGWKEKIDHMADEDSPGGMYAQRYAHVWLGVSVENQETADERIPILLDTPAAHRWISAEPLLGPIDFDLPRCETHDRDEVTEQDGEEYCNECLASGYTGEMSHGHWLDPLNGGIEWIVVGGESGPKARPCDVEWIRSIVGQCKAAEVPVFVKQLGANPWVNQERMEEPANCWVHNVKDRAGRDPSEWPEDLRCQFFPSEMST